MSDKISFSEYCKQYFKPGEAIPKYLQVFFDEIEKKESEVEEVYVKPGVHMVISDISCYPPDPNNRLLGPFCPLPSYFQTPESERERIDPSILVGKTIVEQHHKDDTLRLTFSDGSKIWLSAMSEESECYVDCTGDKQNWHIGHDHGFDVEYLDPEGESFEDRWI